MTSYKFTSILAFSLALVPAPLLAQVAESANASGEELLTGETTASAEATVPAAPVPSCELHVWPTENYLGVKMGLFSGFGLVGAAFDQAGHAKGVATVKDLMREYLGPEVQLAELDKLDYMGKLKLSSADYVVIVHEPTPWNEDLNDNPELKAQTKAFNKKLKDGKRVTDSTNPCYAELIGTHVFYHKAMMYGSNLFTGWQFRRFDGNRLLGAGIGQVKNPLEHFPPKDESMVEAAKVELRDAYSKVIVYFANSCGAVIRTPALRGGIRA